MTCKNCNADLPENAMFCPTCGVEVLQKNNFCSKCGRKLKEDENACPICEGGNATKKQESTVTLPYRKIAKIAVVIVLGLLFVCAEGMRLLFAVVAFWTVPIAIVGLIVQLFRGRPLKKFGLALGGALLVFLAFSLIENVPVNIGTSEEMTIVGDWEAVQSTVKGEMIFLDQGESITLVAGKNGKVNLKSYDHKIDLELYWSYDADMTERLRIETDDSTLCVYDLLYGDPENGVKAFRCMVHKNDLYIQSSNEIDAGEFSAYFDRVN